MTDAGLWEPHLRDGERLIWTGRARGGWWLGEIYRDGILVWAIVAAILFLPIALSGGDNGAPTVIGLTTWSVAVIVVFLLLNRDRRLRQSLRYAITDPRVLSMDANARSRIGEGRPARNQGGLRPRPRIAGPPGRHGDLPRRGASFKRVSGLPE